MAMPQEIRRQLWPKRSKTRSQRELERFRIDDKLNATIFCTSDGSLVVCQRVVGAVRDSKQLLHGNAIAADELIQYGLSLIACQAIG